MKFSSILHELATTRSWNMEPGAFQAYKQLIFSNIELRAEMQEDERKAPHIRSVLNSAATGASVYAGNLLGLYREQWDKVMQHDKIINVLNISFPITRNSGPCNYGSLELRNFLMQVADIPKVIGHIIILNTPGGSSSALQDYQMAFDYIRQKGQPIYGLVDGVCASLGTGIAVHCDHIYYVNPKDEIGSIGTYCGFFTQKDGDENTITHETYREFYADRSTDKNSWYKKAAQGDMTEIAEEVNKTNEEFIAYILTARPSVTDDQLSGKMFRCGDVVGSLTDGQATLKELATLMAEQVLSASAGEGAIAGTAQATAGNLSIKGSISFLKGFNDGKAAAAQHQAQTTHNMEKYPFICAAIGTSELAYDNEAGSYMNDDLLAALETALAEKDSMQKDLEAAEKVQEELVLVKANLSAMSEELETAKADLTARDATIEQLTADFEGAKASLATAEGTIAERDATIETLNTTVADLENEVKELAENAGAAPAGGAAPEHNNGGAEIKMDDAPNFKNAQNFDKNLEAAAAYRENLKSKAKL